LIRTKNIPWKACGLKMNIDKDFIERAKDVEKRSKMIQGFSFARAVFLIVLLIEIVFQFLPHSNLQAYTWIFSGLMTLAMDSRVKMLKLYDDLVKDE
jgi:hypothetical protein